MKKHLIVLSLIALSIVLLYWINLQWNTNAHPISISPTTDRLFADVDENISNDFDALVSWTDIPTSTPQKTQNSPSSDYNDGTVPATLTPHPTPTLQVTLPTIEGDISRYTFRNPDPETLLKLQLSRTGQMVYSDTQVDKLLYPAFHDIIDYEWNNAYTQSLYSESLFEQIPNFYDHSRGRLTNQMLIDLISDHLTGIFNASNKFFEDKATYATNNFYGRIFPIEIDGDPLPEWLVEVKDESGFYLSSYSFWMTFDQNNDSGYRRLTNQIPWIWGISSLNELDFQLSDLTGDGMTDIALLESNCSIDTCNRRFHIAIGNKSGHYLISSIPNIVDDTGVFTTNWAEINWTISPVNMLPVLSITFFQDIGWGCVTAAVQEYQWMNGEKQAHSILDKVYKRTDQSQQIEDIPDNDAHQGKCLIAKSLESSVESDLTEQINLLETSLNYFEDLALEDQVYLLYRLGLLHALDNDPERSMFYLNQIGILAEQNESTIANSLMTEIENIGSTHPYPPYNLCMAAEKISNPDIDASLNPLLEKVKYSYDGFEDGYPAPLCDIHTIASNYFRTLTIDPNQSPDQVLNEVGIPFRVIQKISPNPADPHWVITIETPGPPYPVDQENLSRLNTGGELLVYWFTKGKGWELIKTLPLSSAITYNLTDITGDNIIDFAFFLPDTSPESSLCTIDEKPIDIFMITKLGNDSYITFEDTICLKSHEIISFVYLYHDEDKDGIPEIIEKYFEENLFDLTLLPETEANGQSAIYRKPYSELAIEINKDAILTDLTRRILKGSYSQDMINELEDYKELWGGDDPIGENIQAQINYLLALSYELNGERRKSVAYFYEIWANQPTTIWAYLASIHLE
jgi:hypothetical protein